MQLRINRKGRCYHSKARANKIEILRQNKKIIFFLCATYEQKLFYF